MPEPLNADPARYFTDAYQQVMYTGAVGWYSRLVHWLMERRFHAGVFPVVLELGAGAGQHARFVQGAYEVYWETDRDPALADMAPTGRDARIRRATVDATDLSQFPDGSVDRIVATCLLAHLPDPVAALAEWRRVLRPGGWVTVYVPSEPGMLLRAARTLVVAPKSRRHGQDHLAMIYADHINHYPGMRAAMRSVFAGDRVERRRYPTRLVGWNFSLFEIWQIQKR